MKTRIFALGLFCLFSFSSGRADEAWLDQCPVGYEENGFFHRFPNKVRIAFAENSHSYDAKWVFYRKWFLPWSRGLILDMALETVYSGVGSKLLPTSLPTRNPIAESTALENFFTFPDIKVGFGEIDGDPNREHYIPLLRTPGIPDHIQFTIPHHAMNNLSCALTGVRNYRTWQRKLKNRGLNPHQIRRILGDGLKLVIGDLVQHYRLPGKANLCYQSLKIDLDFTDESEPLFDILWDALDGERTNCFLGEKSVKIKSLEFEPDFERIEKNVDRVLQEISK